MSYVRGLLLIAFLCGFTISFSAPAHAGKEEKAARVVNDATAVLKDFAADIDYRSLWNYAQDAEAIVVIPSSVRGGFLVGASGGNGVMLARKDDGGWSQPSFLRVSSLSFGFQAGGDVSAIVLVCSEEHTS
ncbi:MAG: lipid-binding SYLF domain-containing protein, partial [Pseudomonadota bacterium]